MLCKSFSGFYYINTASASAQVVETSVTNNSSFQNYLYPDDHTIRTTDTPGFKPFTMINTEIYSEQIHQIKIVSL